MAQSEAAVLGVVSLNLVVHFCEAGKAGLKLTQFTNLSAELGKMIDVVELGAADG